MSTFGSGKVESTVPANFSYTFLQQDALRYPPPSWLQSGGVSAPPFFMLPFSFLPCLPPWVTPVCLDGLRGSERRKVCPCPPAAPQRARTRSSPPVLCGPVRAPPIEEPWLGGRAGALCVWPSGETKEGPPGAPETHKPAQGKGKIT